MFFRRIRIFGRTAVASTEWADGEATRAHRGVLGVAGAVLARHEAGTEGTLGEEEDRVVTVTDGISRIRKLLPLRTLQ